MSLAVKRLKRAIDEAPTGGMQTGSPNVQLKLAEAYMAIAEIKYLSGVNAELCAMLDKILNSTQPASDFYAEAEQLLAKARGEA